MVECYVCREITERAIPATNPQGGHDLYLDYTKTHPSCTEVGVGVFSCSNCSFSEDQTLPMLSHDWNQISATTLCGEDGNFERKCYDCGKTEKGSLLYLEHETIFHEGSAPTCYYSGCADYETCGRCNYSTYTTLPPTNHAGAEWVVEIEPTQTSKGLRRRVCSACNLDETATIPETIYSDFLLYEKGTYSSYYTVVGIDPYVGNTLKNISIPKTYNGYPVLEIDDGAFENNDFIESITLSGDLQIVGENAFKNCTSLISANLEGAKDVCANAFYGCTKLETCNLGQKIETVGSYAFYDCTSLGEISLCNNTRKIYESAFENCSSLTSVDLSTRIDTIERNAFKNCTSLETLLLPSSLTTIASTGGYIISNAPALRNFEFKYIFK